MMKRTAILADIHGNAPALAAVLADARQQQCDEYWFLGDIFGYGPLPVSCIRMLDEVEPTVWLMGNHDLSAMRLWKGVTMKDDVVQQMTPGKEQRWIAKWHAAQVQVGVPKRRAEELAIRPTWDEPRPGFLVAHGAILDDDPHAPRSIDANSYVKPWQPTAAVMLDFLHGKPNVSEPRFIAVGHYHQPIFAFARHSSRPYDIDWHAGQEIYSDEKGGSGRWPFPTSEESPTVIINPGSVGQPRFVAGDKRAAYAILEEDDGKAAVYFRRVEYDVGELHAAKLLMPPPNSRQSNNWWSVIEPILNEWIEKESSHES